MSSSSSSSTESDLKKAIDDEDLSQVRTLLLEDPSLCHTVLDDDNKTPILLYAIQQKGAEIMIDDLLAAGSFASQPDKNGWSALHEMAVIGEAHLDRIVRLWQEGKAHNKEANNGEKPSQLLLKHESIQKRQSELTWLKHRESFKSDNTPQPNDRWRCTVEVVRARDLAPKDSNGLSDPYYIVGFPGSKPGKIDKKNTFVKSSVVNKTLNPVWSDPSQTFSCNLYAYGVPPEVVIQVFDKDIIGSDDFEGEVRINLREYHHMNLTPRWFPIGQGPVYKGEVSGDILIKLKYSTA